MPIKGLGINSLPFAIASSGWVGGSLSLLAVTFFCWKSAIFIARGLNGDIRPAKTFTKSPFEAALNPRKTSDPRFGAPSVSYPDFLRKAFGETGAIIGTLMLCFELFCGMVAYLMSGGQNLALLFENTPREILVLALGGVSLIPTVLLKTPRLLSYLGFVGTSVTTSLVLTLLALVFSQGDISELVADQEGDPSEDNNLHPIFIASGIPTTLAICSFSFCGHAFLPSIYTSMKTPQDFERVIDVSFGIIFCVYLTFGLSGYYLFGSLVADQVTMTLSIYGSPVGLMKTLTGVVGERSPVKATKRPMPLSCRSMNSHEAISSSLLPLPRCHASFEGYTNSLSRDRWTHRVAQTLPLHEKSRLLEEALYTFHQDRDHATRMSLGLSGIFVCPTRFPDWISIHHASLCDSSSCCSLDSFPIGAFMGQDFRYCRSCCVWCNNRRPWNG